MKFLGNLKSRISSIFDANEDLITVAERFEEQGDFELEDDFLATIRLSTTTGNNNLEEIAEQTDNGNYHPPQPVTIYKSGVNDNFQEMNLKGTVFYKLCSNEEVQKQVYSDNQDLSLDHVSAVDPTISEDELSEMATHLTSPIEYPVGEFTLEADLQTGEVSLDDINVLDQEIQELLNQCFRTNTREKGRIRRERQAEVLDNIRDSLEQTPHFEEKEFDGVKTSDIERFVIAEYTGEAPGYLNINPDYGVIKFNVQNKAGYKDEIHEALKNESWKYLQIEDKNSIGFPSTLAQIRPISDNDAVYDEAAETLDKAYAAVKDISE